MTTPRKISTALLAAVMICGSNIVVLGTEVVSSTGMSIPSLRATPRTSTSTILNTSTRASTTRELRKNFKQEQVATDDSEAEQKRNPKRQNQSQQASINPTEANNEGKDDTADKDTAKEEATVQDRVGDKQEDVKAEPKDSKQQSSQESVTTSKGDTQNSLHDSNEAKDKPEDSHTQMVHPSGTSFSLESPANASRSNNWTMAVNVTAISLTACEHIEMAVSFITSLDLDQDFMNLSYQLAYQLAGGTGSSNSNSNGNNQDRSRAIWDVYLLQIIITPLSLAMGFFGSNLLLPTCCLAAAGLGVFMVFHLLHQLSQSSSKYATFFQIDCQMRLALGVVSASISAMAANFFVRFGLFSLGALSAGGAAYLVMDAFPWLDPTREDDSVVSTAMIDGTTGSASSADYTALLHHSHQNQSSELSPFGWTVAVMMGVWGGLFLRWYEQASLEVVTAIMGGLGFAYSFHTLVILQGGEIHRSIVFLLANFVAFLGWKYQRGRRHWKYSYSHKKNYEESPSNQSSKQEYSLVSQKAASPPPPLQTLATSPPPLQTPDSWDQLQASMYSVQGLLQRSQYPQSTATTESKKLPSAEEIVALTKSLQTLLQRMNTSENVHDKNPISDLNKQQRQR
jgi:hypothetical protein